MFAQLSKKMAEAPATTTPSEIQIYNKDVASKPFIKILIPASAVTAATLAGTLTYTATNASVSALSTATEFGINGFGFLLGKTAGALVSPIVGASISVGSGFAATAAKETIQTKGKLLSIATGSVAGAGAAIAVTAGSYIFSGLQSLGESVVSTLHNWARTSEYSENDNIAPPPSELEIIDEFTGIVDDAADEPTAEFMKQVEKIAHSPDLSLDTQ